VPRRRGTDSRAAHRLPAQATGAPAGPAPQRPPPLVTGLRFPRATAGGCRLPPWPWQADQRTVILPAYSASATESPTYTATLPLGVTQRPLSSCQ